MKLKTTSITNLIFNSNEATIYGLESCRYEDVANALAKSNIKVYKWDSKDFGFPIINYDALSFDTEDTEDKTTTGRKYKSIITSLIIENCKRVKEGKPIIPLIFCIGLEENNQPIKKLNIKATAQSHKSCMTDKELRRCYKIYAEGSPEVKAVAAATFNFVKVKQDPANSDEYTLEKVKPFWEEVDWDQAWQERTHLPDEFPKQHNWRSIFQAAINRLFQPSNDDSQLKTNNTNSTITGVKSIRSRL